MGAPPLGKEPNHSYSHAQPLKRSTRAMHLRLGPFMIMQSGKVGSDHMQKVSGRGHKT